MVVLTQPVVYCAMGVVLGIADLDTEVLIAIGKFRVTTELIFGF
jgi:hypothetical protein